MTGPRKGCNKASFQEKCAAMLFKIDEPNAYLESLNNVQQQQNKQNIFKVTDGTQKAAQTNFEASKNSLMHRNWASFVFI